MSRGESALQALEMMQALPSDSSDGEFSDNEEYEAVNAVEAVAEIRAEISDSEDKKIAAVLPRPFGSEKNMGQSHDKTQPADSTNADTPCKVRIDHFGCWLLHLNVCKVACNSKT